MELWEQIEIKDAQTLFGVMPFQLNVIGVFVSWIFRGLIHLWIVMKPFRVFCSAKCPSPSRFYFLTNVERFVVFGSLGALRVSLARLYNEIRFNNCCCQFHRIHLRWGCKLSGESQVLITRNRALYFLHLKNEIFLWLNNFVQCWWFRETRN